MTEAEAKTKWCPFVRATPVDNDEYPGGWIQRPDGLASLQCIGSDCMAWRWGEKRWNRKAEASEPDPESGYCGLAGKP